MNVHGDYLIRPLVEIPTSAAADALAAAFAADGNTPSEWRTMLSRELETGRADARASCVAVSRPTGTRPLTSPRVVGVCLVHFADEPFGHIGATGVRKTDRGRGLGRALVAYALDALDQARRTDVVLEVERGNVVARTLYTSMGFRSVRALHTLVLDRTRLVAGPTRGPRPIVRIPIAEAIAAVGGLQRTEPAFQRRAEHLATFSDETMAFGLVRAGRIEAQFIQKGHSLFDLQAPPDPALVRPLLELALETSPLLRLIHVSDDDPLLRTLLDLGCVISITVDELRMDLRRE